VPLLLPYRTASIIVRINLGFASNLMLVLAYLTSDFEFKIQSALWEEHIVPVIIRLENIAQTRPIKSSFENDEEFEEALGFWTRPDCLREG
jgi:hypothetical protein|tara:strand:+ start:37 stop:309 length:273 start_codon:yes stop_codon:yes gene_type:complete